MGLSKWEQKQAAAKAAEEKFADNQRRLAKHKEKQKRKGKGAGEGEAAALDDIGSQLGDVDIGKRVGPLGWLIGHKWILGVLAVLAAGGVIFGMCMCVRYQLKTIPGWPKSELFIAGSPGTLIVIDHVEVGGTDSKGRPQASSGEGERLTAIDADTGKELAVEVSDYKECWSGGTRAICVDIYDRVDILDPRTLDVVATASDLIATAKLAKPSRRYHRAGEDVIVVLEDGRGAQIDATKLSVTTLETVESPWIRPEPSSCETASMAQLGTTRLYFDSSGTRRKLRSEPPPPAESPTPSGPALTYLDGQFLQLAEPLPIVLQRVSTESDDGIVARVEGVSKEKWSVPLGGECKRAWLYGPLLVIATGNAGQRALAIDLASGRLVWTFGR